MILILILNSESYSLSLTLDKLGFWEYFARFILDKFINGPSGLVNIEAWRKSRTKLYYIENANNSYLILHYYKHILQ